jgi:hypothetical protein
VGLALACAREFAGCKPGGSADGKGDPAASAPSANPAAPAQSAGPRAESDAYRVTLAPEPCKAGAECTVHVRLDVLGPWHLNDAYPYKFKAEPAAGTEFLGQDAEQNNIFSRAAGDFKPQGEKQGILDVRFKHGEKGAVDILGTYNFSVCSAEKCRLEKERLAVNVPVD